MKHLLICGEFPPAPSGGIGTYAATMSRLLASAGETVHVISKSWLGAESGIDMECDGKLIIHRLPYEDWASILPRQPHPSLEKMISKKLFSSRYPPQCFSWSAALTAERLVEEEDIDVIEAQEYEAPLYFFQLRRALGMGPQRKPPCIVHLHSPTELIARHSEWNSARHDLAIANHFEDYTIRAADQLLCPSRYLASQMALKYGLASDDICVVPYPIGATPAIERSEDVWSSGTVLFIGRLELRKGVIEWVDAAISVANERPEVQFEFVGDDTTHRGTSVLDIIQRRIPRRIARQFHFRGGRKHHEMIPFLKGARICVVPSRWENFPYVCIEAMASGLPVIASDAGGMTDLISDGATGWLGRPDSACLSEMLRCALGTPPEKLARMGVAAESRIRELCDSETICDAHLSLRRTLVIKGAQTSVSVPSAWPQKSIAQSTQDLRVRNSESGIAVIVVCSPTDRQLQQCLHSIRLQSRKPIQVVVMSLNPVLGETPKELRELLPSSSRLLCAAGADPIDSRQLAIDNVLDSDLRPLGLVVITPKDELKPDFLELSEALLVSNPHVGVVTGWIASAKRARDVWIRPIFPRFRDSFEDAPCVVFRSSALTQYRELTSDGKVIADSWQMADKLANAGWQCITIPRVWARHRFRSALSQFVDKVGGMLWSASTGRTRSCGRPDKTDVLADTFIVWREQMNLIKTLLRRPLHTGTTFAVRLRSKVARRNSGDSLHLES